MIKDNSAKIVDPKQSIEVGDLTIARLKPPNQQDAFDVMKKFGIDMPEDKVSSSGILHVESRDISLTFYADGSYEALFALADRAKTKQISFDKVKSIADEAIHNFGLDRGVSLAFDEIFYESEGGQHGQGSSISETEEPQITQTVIVFRQSINKLRVITPGKGELTIWIDNSGRIIKISSTLRQIEGFILPSRKTTDAPPDYLSRSAPEVPDTIWYKRILDRETQKRLASWIFSGQIPMQFTIIPGSDQIGYDIRDDEAVPIARRAIDVDFGNGYHKRYWIRAATLE